MKRQLLVATASLLLLLLARNAAAQGQPAADEKCEGPVYTRQEVTRRAVLTAKPEPTFTDAARQSGLAGVVRLSAVLCRTGRVTDIAVVEGLPHGLTEATVEAARRIKFNPAEKNGRAASQRITLEYVFNTFDSDGGVPGKCQDSPALCAGKLVEEVQIEGNRRAADTDILYYLKTRPGDTYDQAQVQRDLQALLALPYFDKTATRVRVEAGRRGGIVVVFTVMELPVIRDITFRGLRSASEAEVMRALREKRAAVWKEGVYDPAKAREAERAVREFLAERGRPDASVQVNVVQASSQSVVLEFVIDEGPKGPPPKWLRTPRRKSLQTPQVARASQTGVEIG